MYQISDEAARRIAAAYIDISRTYDGLSVAAQEDTELSYWWALLLTAAEELHAAGEPLLLHQLPDGVTDKRSDVRRRRRKQKARV